MGDPENEGRFAHAREIHRRALQGTLEHTPKAGVIVASFTLRASVQPLPSDRAEPDRKPFDRTN